MTFSEAFSGPSSGRPSRCWKTRWLPVPKICGKTGSSHALLAPLVSYPFLSGPLCFRLPKGLSAASSVYLARKPEGGHFARHGVYKARASELSGIWSEKEHFLHKRADRGRVAEKMRIRLGRCQCRRARCLQHTPRAASCRATEHVTPKGRGCISGVDLQVRFREPEQIGRGVLLHLHCDAALARESWRVELRKREGNVMLRHAC